MALTVDETIRTRRTVKEYVDVAVDAASIRELLELAVQAPNHHLTAPWRFWVVGSETVKQLTAATGDRKLGRSASAVVVGFTPDDDPEVAREDEAACAAAIQTFMLAATARGLATFWRTPGVMRRPAFGETLGASAGTRFVGYVHVGHAAGAPPIVEVRSAPAHTAWLP